MSGHVIRLAQAVVLISVLWALIVLAMAVLDRRVTR